MTPTQPLRTTSRAGLLRRAAGLALDPALIPHTRAADFAEAVSVYERWNHNVPFLRHLVLSCNESGIESAIQQARDALSELHMHYLYFRDAPADQLAVAYALGFVGEELANDWGCANIGLESMRAHHQRAEREAGDCR